MERLTKRNESGQAYYKKCFEEPCNGMGERDCDTCEHSYAACERLADYEDLEIVAEQVRDLDKICTQTMQELGKYKKLEERLNSLFNGQLTLEDIVNGLERTLIEPNSPHPVNAKVLTHAEAAEWDEYQRLKEQGLLILSPCRIGDKVYHIIKDHLANPQIYISEHEVKDVTAKAVYAADMWWKIEEMPGMNAFLSKEAAEQALKEMENKMDIKKFAEMLNGKEYGFLQFTEEEIQIAKDNGFVIVYGESDDLMEFDGAICNEVGCFDGDGGKVYFNEIGVCCDEEFENSRCIEALWCDDETRDKDGSLITWTYKTDIPHETFMILDNGESYCRGIVFDIKDLK